jgi:HK97 family phage prohead protease
VSCNHFGNGSRAWRLKLARLHFDVDAQALIAAEINGCADCWEQIAREMISREMSQLVFTAGFDRAVEYVESWALDMMDAEQVDREDRNDNRENRTMATTELRSTGMPVEVRSSRTIGGYAATFNSRSQPLAGFREVVSSTFFNESRDTGWEGVICRWQHKSEFLLGATGSGTLRCSIDSVGLDYSVDLPECRGDVLESVRRGDLAHSSFSFVGAQDDWGFEDGLPLRTLISGHLVDVAPVDVPAYRNSSVAMRSLAAKMSAPVEDVVALAESGELRQLFTRSDQPLTGAMARALAYRRRYEPTGLDGRLAQRLLAAKQFSAVKRLV